MRTKNRIKKAGALCIRHNKLLVVHKRGLEDYITLGGKIEPGETPIRCLQREVREEIGCSIRNPKYFATFLGLVNDSRGLSLRCYIVELKGNPKLNQYDSVDKYYWISCEDYKKYKIPLAPLLKERIIPSLIERGLLK
ncbi:NUDIX domain-containing protein [Candidatus Pacearchaeota archaeon]|nr:NUDIX domain-containing protein [Candidatus Pacearchaeota archaeon]